MKVEKYEVNWKLFNPTIDIDWMKLFTICQTFEVESPIAYRIFTCGVDAYIKSLNLLSATF